MEKGFTAMSSRAERRQGEKSVSAAVWQGRLAHLHRQLMSDLEELLMLMGSGEPGAERLRSALVQLRQVAKLSGTAWGQ